jgi:hypothetical protein
MKKKTTLNFWSFLGKFSLFITLLWTTWQIYSSISTNAYEFEATGKHFKYRPPNDYYDLIKDYETTLLLDKAYRDEINSKGLSVNKLIDYAGKTENKEFLESYDYHKKWTKLIDIPIYNYTWEFQIDNSGSNPLEELIIETPFDGYYRISRENEDDVHGTFSKNIPIEKLNPGYSVGIRIWIHDTYGINVYDEEKTRVTHKFGFKQISYPTEVKGFSKWLISDYEFPIFLKIIILLFLFFLTFIAGVSFYPKWVEMENKRKIEEYKKFEEAKEIAEKLVEMKESESEISEK